MRLNNRVPNFSSSRLIAFETVAFDSLSSSGGADKGARLHDFAKIAKPSKVRKIGQQRYMNLLSELNFRSTPCAPLFRAAHKRAGQLRAAIAFRADHG